MYNDSQLQATLVTIIGMTSTDNVYNTVMLNQGLHFSASYYTTTYVHVHVHVVASHAYTIYIVHVVRLCLYAYMMYAI